VGKPDIDTNSCGRLDNVRDVYEETPQSTYELGRSVDTPMAQALFLSGTGMPTVAILAKLEQDLGKPVIPAACAMMWYAVQLAGLRHPTEGYSRLNSASGQ
jgi:maleate cis-trans isomerase